MLARMYITQPGGVFVWVRSSIPFIGLLLGMAGGGRVHWVQKTTSGEDR